MRTERNVTLDFFKLFLSFLVILLHSYPLFDSFVELSTVSWLISNGIARIAVPSFYLMNGFYLTENKINNKSIFKYIKKLLIMYFVWVLIYSYSMDIEKNTIYAVCKQILFGYGHLWYLLSFAEALFILWLLKKIKISDFCLFTISILLYVIGYFIQRHYMAFDSINTYFYNSYSRNALFFALPFISIGFLIAKNKSKLIGIKNNYLILLLILFSISLLFESYLFSLSYWRMDFLISILLLSPVLLIYILKQSKYSQDANSIIVGQISAGVYLIHAFCLSIIEPFSKNENSFFYAIFAFFLSIVLSYSIVKVNDKIKIFL